MSPYQERSTLKELLGLKSVQVGRTFKLSSGAESNVYVDAKRTTCLAEAMPLVGRIVLWKIKELGWEPQAIGGLTLGADPIALAVARESVGLGGAPINAFIVRKQPKKHGMQQFIEGPVETEGLRVVIVDDVCTGGGSTGEAIDKVRKAGMNVIGAICLVDREAGATEFLQQNFQCRLESIFKLSELLAEHQKSSVVADPIGAHK